MASSVCGNYEVEGLLKCKSPTDNECRIIIHEGSFSEKTILIKDVNPILRSLDSNFIRAKIAITSIKSKLPLATILETPLRLPMNQGYFKKIGDGVCK